MDENENMVDERLTGKRGKHQSNEMEQISLQGTSYSNLSIEAKRRNGHRSGGRLSISDDDGPIRAHLEFARQQTTHRIQVLQ